MCKTSSESLSYATQLWPLKCIRLVGRTFVCCRVYPLGTDPTLSYYLKLL